MSDLFSPNLGNLQNALERTSQRQSLLMMNMANVNVPGYKRKDVDFHVALQGQIAEQHERDMADQRAQDASDKVSIRTDGNNVDMEHEVMSVNETALHYEALTQMTSAYFTDLKSAIREGK
jgi:flagellar basal-body rod protein FlgB